MLFRSQDGHRLVNGNYVRQFYSEETPDGVKLVAASDTDIVLGTYDTIAQADAVIEFIGSCSVDKDAQNKVTDIPTIEDVDRVMSLDKQELLGRVLAAAKKGPEDGNDSEPDLRAMLKDLFN